MCTKRAFPRHVSFNRWLIRYLYIPLGGRKCSDCIWLHFFWNFCYRQTKPPFFTNFEVPPDKCLAGLWLRCNMADFHLPWLPWILRHFGMMPSWNSSLGVCWMLFSWRLGEDRCKPVLAWYPEPHICKPLVLQQQWLARQAKLFQKALLAYIFHRLNFWFIQWQAFVMPGACMIAT